MDWIRLSIVSSVVGRSESSRKIRLVTVGYQGNFSAKQGVSGVASHKKILLKTPCPGRNLPEDTCCFELPGVTGLGEHSTKDDSVRAAMARVSRNVNPGDAGP